MNNVKIILYSSKFYFDPRLSWKFHFSAVEKASISMILNLKYNSFQLIVDYARNELRKYRTSTENRQKQLGAAENRRQ